MTKLVDPVAYAETSYFLSSLVLHLDHFEEASSQAITLVVSYADREMSQVDSHQEGLRRELGQNQIREFRKLLFQGIDHVEVRTKWPAHERLTSIESLAEMVMGQHISIESVKIKLTASNQYSCSVMFTSDIAVVFQFKTLNADKLLVTWQEGEEANSWRYFRIDNDEEVDFENPFNL